MLLAVQKVTERNTKSCIFPTHTKQIIYFVRSIVTCQFNGVFIDLLTSAFVSPQFPKRAVFPHSKETRAMFPSALRCHPDYCLFWLIFSKCS